MFVVNIIIFILLQSSVWAQCSNCENLSIQYSAKFQTVYDENINDNFNDFDKLYAYPSFDLSFRSKWTENSSLSYNIDLNYDQWVDERSQLLNKPLQKMTLLYYHRLNSKFKFKLGTSESSIYDKEFRLLKHRNRILSGLYFDLGNVFINNLTNMEFENYGDDQQDGYSYLSTFKISYEIKQNKIKWTPYFVYDYENRISESPLYSYVKQLFSIGLLMTFQNFNVEIGGEVGEKDYAQRSVDKQTFKYGNRQNFYVDYVVNTEYLFSNGFIISFALNSQKLNSTQIGYSLIDREYKIGISWTSQRANLF